MHCTEVDWDVRRRGERERRTEGAGPSDLKVDKVNFWIWLFPPKVDGFCESVLTRKRMAQIPGKEI
jgi:hypothetical protein